MTCREKLKQECPNEYDRVFTKEGVTAGTECHDCWNREIEEVEYNDIVNTLEYKPQKSEPLFKVNEVKEENGGLTVNMTPIIKDSGDRTEFESGAVRDMRSGKGRFDLVPLEVVGGYLGRFYCKKGESERGDPGIVFNNLQAFMDTGDTDFLYLAIRNFEHNKGFNDVGTMFLEVAKHFEDGALKYGPDNWKRGIPTWCYIDSAARHYLKWFRGDTDEAHNRAFVWNLMCCIWEVDYHKENE